VVSGDPGSPTVSVVCPTYNSAGFAIRTLESVVAQTTPPYELIVSDDGSTDDTVAAVGRFLGRHPEIRSHLIENTHRGPGAARNAGIRLAGGEWIAFLDSDDLWLPHKLKAVSEAIREHQEANLICHSEEHVRRDGSRNLLDYGARFDAARLVGPQQYFTNLFSPSAATCRRSLLLQAGLFDESLPAWQDYDLWLRLSVWVRPVFIREVLGYYCDRPGSITAGNLWRQWHSATKIAIRHRDKVSAGACAYRLLWLTGLFGFRMVHRQ